MTALPHVSDPKPRTGPEWLPGGLLFVMFVATAWTAIVGVQTIRSQELDAVVLDLAGRQRMLNQQYLKESLLASRGVPVDLVHTGQLFLDTAIALADGGVAVADIDTGDTIELQPTTVPGLPAVLAHQRELMERQIVAADAWLELPPSDPDHPVRMAELQSLNRALHRETSLAVRAIDRHEAANVSSAFIWSLAGAGVMVMMVTALFWMNRRQRAIAADRRNAVQHLDAVVNSVIDGIITIDGRGNIQSFSPSAETIFGYTAAEAIGRNVKLLMPEPYHSEHDGYLARYRQTGRAKVIGVGREVTGRRKDGSTFPLDLAVSRMSHGDRSFYVGVTRDITDRKRAEEALARQGLEARLLHQATALAAETDSFDEALQQCVNIVCEITGWPIGHAYLPCAEQEDRLRPAGIWHLPENGDGERFREITERTFFRRGEGLPGRIWETAEPAWIVDVNEDENFPRARAGSDLGVKGAFGFPVKIGGEPVAILEFFFLHKMQPDPHLLMIAASLGEQVGRVIERKRAESALRKAKKIAEQASRAKSQFLATMSHELRTPLNSVIGFSNILLKNKTGNLQQSDTTYLERICSNGKHLLSLINDVLDLSKIEAGRVDLQIEPVDLRAVIEKVFQQLCGQARVENVRLSTELPASMSTVPADEQRVSQILINLIGNAVKFTPAGGTVLVRVVTDDDLRPIRIDVADCGCGVASDKLETIFGSFEQADGSTSRMYGGTGLGLSISRMLSRLMGFEIAATSVVDRGSTFSVMLADDAPAPTHDTPSGEVTHVWDGVAEPDIEAEAAVAGSGGRRSKEPGKVVLVIDDAVDSRMVLENYLEDYGCSVIAVDSAAQGVEVARALRPDLITLDLMMPKVNGWSAFNILKEDPLTKGIPVVIVSIMASENKPRLVGAVNFIDKPMGREELYRVLEQSLVMESCDVLVVEDDPDTRQILVELVKEFGAQARTASNGEEALAQLKSFKPGLILLDLMMPVMDGCAFLKLLRQDAVHSQLPVVVVTAKDLTRDERMLLECSTESIVQKGSVLAESVRAALSSVLTGSPT